MSEEIPNRWLHRHAVLTAVATLVLVCFGGLVTSHGVGMAVPDWPNTNGYNLFLFPVSDWVGGIFYEHTHRLIASAVGFLTLVLALWLHGVRARPLLRWGGLIVLAAATLALVVEPNHRSWSVMGSIVGLLAVATSFVWPNCQPAPRWLRRLGLIAFLSVVVQGVLGGLRVVWMMDSIGVVHATLAQLFLLLTCLMVLFTSDWWTRRRLERAVPLTKAGGLRWGWLLVTALILAQLILGAAMRHRHAGLAIPDFPMAHGAWWPATDPDAIARYNRDRPEERALNPITARDVQLHMVHRLLGVTILLALGAAALWTRRLLGSGHFLARATAVWLALGLGQLLLGAWTVWSNKAADVATAHVTLGSLLLAVGGLLTVTAFASQGHSLPVAQPTPALAHEVTSRQTQA